MVAYSAVAKVSRSASMTDLHRFGVGFATPILDTPPHHSNPTPRAVTTLE